MFTDIELLFPGTGGFLLWRDVLLILDLETTSQTRLKNSKLNLVYQVMSMENILKMMEAIMYFVTESF